MKKKKASLRWITLETSLDADTEELDYKGADEFQENGCGPTWAIVKMARSFYHRRYKLVIANIIRQFEALE
jgi:hypothetical protein